MIDLDTYFYSDPHLGHKTIGDWESHRHSYIENDESLEEMTMKRIDDTIKNNKAVCVGDFAFKSVSKYMNQMNLENTHLVLGNHDKGVKYYLYNAPGGFDVVSTGIDYQINGIMFNNPLGENELNVSAIVFEIHDIKFMVTHYPLFERSENKKRNPEVSALIEERCEVLERWYTELNCRINIHGHMHSKECIDKSIPRINCCLDYQKDFKPKKLRDLMIEQLYSVDLLK